MHNHGDLDNDQTGQGLVVIHVALFRMATQSFAEAYRILGYKTHHGVEDILGNPWDEIEQAAEATWPNVPNARPRPRFTRSDWDKLWGNNYDIVTDLACPFTDQLIQAYPDAKVVIVQRDFDSWWKSYKVGVLDKLFSPGQQIFVFLIGAVIGSRAAEAMLKVNYGLFKAKSVPEIHANAREVYDEYYRNIRATIPADKRLEYTIGDGWEPLCSFLGKDVPDMPFPHLNDSKSRSESQRKGEITVLLNSARKVGILGLGAGTMAIAWWYFAQA
ncbi:hypothetical protein V8C35DRAFT_306792 [Trichoderma chlorosporum]